MSGLSSGSGLPEGPPNTLPTGGGPLLDRRRFLKQVGLGAAAVTTLAAPGLGRQAAASVLPPATNRQLKTAYRLSTHGRRVCNACKGKAANCFFITSKAADSGRAHLGCNCGIVTQDLRARTYYCYFFNGGRRAVFDLRVNPHHCPEP